MMENILCKAFKHFLAVKKGRVTFNDILRPEQLLFVYTSSGMMFYIQDTSCKDFGLGRE